MSTAIAVPGSLKLSTDTESLLFTAAHSVREFLQTTGNAEPTLSSNLKSNFSMHLRPKALPTLETFICSVAQSLKITPEVVVTSLIYVERLSKRLPQTAKTKADTPYRIFLAALLLAEKYWSDQAVKVKLLVMATGGLFRHKEILAMEKALLRVLKFELYVSADHIYGFAKRLGIEMNAT
ncbi:hypothetical protein EV183_004447 [Coemansia sp. RSA 2336]|nr:hypothetical protein EV183_004447 [Coemansia sp. RSA 2336]